MENKIGFLGPKGTFSHQAARRIFAEKGIKEKEFLVYPTIRGIFEAADNGDIDLGIVPAENTLGGIVSETINYLIEYPLVVTAAFNLEIHQCLLARTNNKEELKVIKSHSQALSQCREWLQKNLPKIKLEATSSTTAPIIETKEKEVGFIASEIAAKVHNLNILTKDIEDNRNNLTKFYLLSKTINKELQKKLKSEKTLLLLSAYDRVGVLRDILDVFANESLNLSSLHSVPSRVKPWEYFFFLQIDAPYPSPVIEGALKNIKEYCSAIRVIGVA